MCQLFSTWEGEQRHWSPDSKAKLEQLPHLVRWTLSHPLRLSEDMPALRTRLFE